MSQSIGMELHKVYYNRHICFRNADGDMFYHYLNPSQFDEGVVRTIVWGSVVGDFYTSTTGIVDGPTQFQHELGGEEDETLGDILYDPSKRIRDVSGLYLGVYMDRKYIPQRDMDSGFYYAPYIPLVTQSGIIEKTFTAKVTTKVSLGVSSRGVGTLTPPLTELPFGAATSGTRKAWSLPPPKVSAEELCLWLMHKNQTSPDVARKGRGRIGVLQA